MNNLMFINLAVLIFYCANATASRSQSVSSPITPKISIDGSNSVDVDASGSHKIMKIRNMERPTQVRSYQDLLNYKAICDTVRYQTADADVIEKCNQLENNLALRDGEGLTYFMKTLEIWRKHYIGSEIIFGESKCEDLAKYTLEVFGPKAIIEVGQCKKLFDKVIVLRHIDKIRDITSGKRKERLQDKGMVDEWLKAAMNFSKDECDVPFFDEAKENNEADNSPACQNKIEIAELADVRWKALRVKQKLDLADRQNQEEEEKWRKERRMIEADSNRKQEKERKLKLEEERANLIMERKKLEEERAKFEHEKRSKRGGWKWKHKMRWQKLRQRHHSN